MHSKTLDNGIACHDLTIGYGRRIVQGSITFALPAGTITAMLGANGSGKSTLLRTLAGLQPALSGTYTPQADERVVALVLTEKLSLESTTVRDVVAMGRYPYTSFLGSLSATDEQIVEQAMQQVGIEAIADTFYNDHSDGEKQRILIAKALAQQTPVILLDEPTAHLDLPTRIKTLSLLRHIAHTQQKTILISTHELSLAMSTVDHVLLLFMQQGGILLSTPHDLRDGKAFNQAFGMDILPEINS